MQFTYKYSYTAARRLLYITINNNPYLNHNHISYFLSIYTIICRAGREKLKTGLREYTLTLK